MDTATLQNEWLRAAKPDVLRQAPAQRGPSDPEVYLVLNGVALGAVEVLGRYNHAFQMVGAGTDNFKLQGTLRMNPNATSDWIDIPGQTSLTGADIITQFTGIFRWIRAVKNSGSGTAAAIILLSMR